MEMLQNDLGVFHTDFTSSQPLKTSMLCMLKQK